MEQKLKILLIEDDSDHAEIVRHELSKLKQFIVDFTWVENLDKAKDLLADDDYFIISDLTFPGKTLKECLKDLETIIKSHESPVIILTSLEDYHVGADAIKLGIDDFISKTNLNSYSLEKTILYAIERKKILQELKQSRDVALQAAKAKAEFLAVMSHEIRTPLNGIVGSLNLLKDTGGLSEEHIDYLDTINYSSDALLRIINDILDFSKIESGKMLLENAVFSMSDLIRSVQSIFLPIAEGEKNLEFLAPIPKHEFNMKGDSGKIRQVLINLINNAIKFTTEGSVFLNTKIKKIDDERAEVTIEVEDSGVGIPEDKIDKIFESFTQEDSSTTRKFGGTGLGLSISKKFCEMMGGSLTAKSVIGEGSTFIMKIELEITEETFENVVDIKKAEFSGKILLVEDNLVNQKIASKMLQRMKLEVEHAFNGQDAIEMVNEKEYSLVFMDVMMPVLDGLSATKILRENRFDLPIVAMTASAFEEDRQKCLSAGMNDFISKPINKKEIVRVLSKFLND